MASVISSHANRKAITPSAAKTISTVPSSTLKPTPTKAERRRAPVGDVAEAVDGDRDGEERENEEEPGGEPVHREAEGEARSRVLEQLAANALACREHMEGEQAGDERREARAAEGGPPAQGGPPGERQRHGDAPEPQRQGHRKPGRRFWDLRHGLAPVDREVGMA